MTVALHPSETRVASTPAGTPHRRVRTVVFAGVGVLALAGFATGASTLFSGLADPRARTPRVSPVAANWPDLRDGVPGLTADRTEVVKPALNLLPASAAASASDPVDIRSANATDASGAAPSLTASPATLATVDAKADVSSPAPGIPAVAKSDAGPAKRTPPILNAAIVPAAERGAPVVAPAKTATALPPARSETVRAKDAQPSRFVSLAPTADKPEAAPAPKRKPAQATRAPSPVVRSASADPAAKPVVEATAHPSASDDPELLGVRIPGGRQIRDGLNAVGGLFTGTSAD